MAIKNKRRYTTLSIQSDPIDSGNNLLGDNSPSSTEKVSVSFVDKSDDSNDSLSDNSKVSFAAARLRGKTRRSQTGNNYAIYRRIPSSSVSRTLQSGISASTTVRDTSSVRLYTPPAKKITEDVDSRSSKSSIPIGVMTGMDGYLLEHSISNLRPELIASFDWMPARSTSGRKGYMESLLEFRWAMRQLQIENVEEVIKALKDADIGGVYTRLQQKYEYYSEKEEMWIEWREKILQVLSSAKKSLDIKDNSWRLRGETSKLYAKKSELGTSTGKNTNLKDLFINDLRFSEEGYKKFSNSKVYGQMLYDLYYACRYHSPALVTDKESERSEDENSTSLNYRIVPKSKFYKFRIQKLGNREWKNQRGQKRFHKFDATKFNNYSRFISSLPADDSDKIKVLTTTISNEMCTSAGIGYLTGTSLGKRFNVDLHNPYWWALGRVRKNILDDGWPRGSLASFVLLNDSRNRLILPFETRDFADKDGKTAVAGSTALVDGIMRFGNLHDGLDFEPYFEFGSELKSTTDDVVEYLQLLLNMNDPDQRLHSRNIFLKILKSFATCIHGTRSNVRKSEQQLITAALMNLSRENPRLRHKLLRFTLEIRDARDQLVIDTGAEEFLEPDADSPIPRPPDPSIQLSRIGGFRPYAAITADWIQKTYNISANAAINLVRTTSSYSELWKKAKEASAAEQAERRKEYYRMASKWQRTSLYAAIIARNTMDDSRRPPEETNTRSIIKLRPSGIISALRKSAQGVTSYYSLFSHVIKIARQIQEEAVELADRDGAGGVYMDASRLTKYNGWDENALIAAIFEIFTILYTRFVSAELVRHGRMCYVKYNAEINDRAYKALEDVISISMNQDPHSRAKQIKEREATSEQPEEIVLTRDMMEGKLSVLDALQSASNVSSAEAVFADIQTFMNMFDDELEFKNLIMSHLQAIGDDLGTSALNVKTFFNTGEEDFSITGIKKYQTAGRYIESSRIRRYMAWKTKTVFGQDILKSLTPHQLALQRVASKKLSRKENDDSYLPSEMILEAEEIVALKSFLNSPPMRGVVGGNIRVMTIGVPMDTIDILQNPPYTLGKKNNTELSKAKDVFEIHIHKRDLEYEDIVFKPKKFVYDRSIFLLPESFKKIYPSENVGRRKRTRTWNFDAMVKSTEFTMANEHGLYSKTALQLYDHWKYKGVPGKKRVEMIQNHITNRLLHIYYRLLNGLTLDENTFLKHEEWGQLLVDADAAKMLQLAQAHEKTKWWIYTGTIPAGNLLLDTKIQNNPRTRVATFKDAEIWAKPSMAQLARLARDLRIAEKGHSKRYHRRSKYITYGEAFRRRWGTVAKRAKYLRAIHHQQLLVVKSRYLAGHSNYYKSGSRANPTPKQRTYPISKAARRYRSAWNKMVRKRNKWVNKKNREARKHNRAIARYQAKRFKFLRRRFFRKKPRLSSYHMQHFRMICASRILGPCAMINQILAPRTFDRVLMIPVDPDDFEIDMIATTDVLAGRSAAEQKEFLDMTEEVQNEAGHMIRKLKPRRRSENYSSFNDFFATVSTLSIEEDDS